MLRDKVKKVLFIQGVTLFKANILKIDLLKNKSRWVYTAYKCLVILKVFIADANLV